MKFFLLLFISSFVFMGCRKPDPQPELRDPIYLSIQKELKEAQASLKAIEAEHKDNTNNLDKIEPYTRQSKTFWQKYWSSEKKLRKAQQMVDFYNLHLINRKYAARDSYIRAFNSKNEGNWPNPNQYQRYLTNKRLKEAPRKWDSEAIARQINESQ
jgi:LAS superfamily LD-carboxypeptidase LdcB